MWIVILIIAIIILLAIAIWFIIKTQRYTSSRVLNKATTPNISPSSIPVVENTNTTPMPISVGSSRFPSKYMVPYITQPVDQHECNACWAIAVCQSVSDRMRLRLMMPIQKYDTNRGKHTLVLPTGMNQYTNNDQLNFYAFHDIIAQKEPSDSCAAGALLDTGMQMSVTQGAPLMAESTDRVFADYAPVSDFNATMYKVKGWNHLTIQGQNGTNVPATIQAIKNELRTNGSIIAVINLYDSYENFMGVGVYSPTNGEQTDPNMAHMVSIVGYDDSDHSWIIRNSYGSDWGQNGFAKIPQGDKKLDTESFVYAATI